MSFDAKLSRTQPYEDGPPKRGISDLVALALISLDLDVVQRSTLRALCPNGRGEHRLTGEQTKSNIGEAFARALRRFDQWGWIKRDGMFLEVVDRASLRDWIASGVDVNSERAWSMLAVGQAMEQVNAGVEIRTPQAEDSRTAEVRRQELIALKRLMESGPGASHSGGSRSVRIVPRGGVL